MINISELIVPPLAAYGWGFASIPLHMLSIDFSNGFKPFLWKYTYDCWFSIYR
ncbi:MAG: hypothetical protein QXF09_01570 [Nitrososphaerota archaeon]